MKKKWIVKLGFFKMAKRGDGLAFMTSATTETITLALVLGVFHNNTEEEKRRMTEVARAFYPKIFDKIKSMKKQGWMGVVLQSTKYIDEDGEHFLPLFNNLINKYVNLRGEIEWKESKTFLSD